MPQIFMHYPVLLTLQSLSVKRRSNWLFCFSASKT